MSNPYDERDPSTVQWDPETGLPIGLKGPPGNRVAPAYQWHSNELIAQKNAGLRRSAMAFLDQGARLSESFRPGGFASLMSGIYQDRARTALGSQIEPQDLMAGWRAEQDFQARKAARRAGYLGLAGSLIGAAGSVAGAAIGGPAGAAVGHAVLNPQTGGAGIPEGQGYGPQAPSYPSAPGTVPSGQAMLGPGGGGAGYPTSQPGGGPGMETPGLPSDVPGSSGSPGIPGGAGAAEARMGGGEQGGADPYSLAQIIHTFNTQDGFDDGIQSLTRHMLAHSMASSGLMEDMVA